MTNVVKHPPPKHADSKPEAPVKPGEAVHNPQKAFDSPMDVAETPALPREAKEKAVQTWEADEKALQRASDEGMTGGVPPRLQEVKKAQRKLKSRSGKR